MIRVYKDDINETQQRALDLPKCSACFQYGHNTMQCPITLKERSKYIKDLVKRNDVSKTKRRELISKWRYRSKLCINYGKNRHENDVCPNQTHCIVCNCNGHQSGKKSLDCKELIKLAKATLSYDFQYNKCCNYLIYHTILYSFQ